MSDHQITVCECGAETDGDSEDPCAFCGSSRARVELRDETGRVWETDYSRWYVPDRVADE